MKKIVATLLICLGIVFTILGIQSVSQIDLVRGKISIWNAIVLDFNIFDAISNQNIRGNVNEYVILFWLSIIIFFVVSIIMYKSAKVKSVIMIVSNLFLIMGIIICYKNRSYIIIMILLSIFASIEVFIIGLNKSVIGIIISALTVCIEVLNIFFLMKHLSIETLFNQTGLDITADKVKGIVRDISRINIICFGLFLLPCIIIITNQLISKHSDKKTI